MKYLLTMHLVGTGYSDVLLFLQEALSYFQNIRAGRYVIDHLK